MTLYHRYLYSTISNVVISTMTTMRIIELASAFQILVVVSVEVSWNGVYSLQTADFNILRLNLPRKDVHTDTNLWCCKTGSN